MADSNPGDDPRETRLNEILAAYLQAQQRGEAPDRRALAALHPEFAAELTSFFADQDRFQQAAGPIKFAAAVDPTLASGPSVLPAGQHVRYFGDYEVIEEIARGGMGVVYRARQVNLNRIVALKMVLAGQLATRPEIQRFYAEAEAAAKLAHPNIVQIFEVGQHENQHYFSMAFVDGESLAHRIARGVLEPREAARLMKEVSSAIAYAHVEGVIHRDLKPGNILIDRDGAPRLTDFGLAKRVAGEASGLTATGQVLGTPSYMPPEQARGESAKVTQLSDVYALGAVLYCLVTGRPPFQAASPVETLLQVMTHEPVSPRQLNSAVPLDLETIILKCLEKEPSRRYSSSQHLVDELARFLDGRPILARPLSLPARAWRKCKRHPLTTALIACIAASLLLGTIVSSCLAAEARRQEAEAKRKTCLAEDAKQRADEQSATRLFEQSLVTCEYVDPRHGLLWLVRSLEEASEIKAIELEQSVRRQLGAWSRDLHPLRAVLPHSQTVLAVAFAPDGKSLVTASANPGVNSPNSEAQRWDAITGQPIGRPVKQQHKSIITAVALTPDGSLLLTGSFDQTAQLWSVATGKPVGPPLPHQGSIVTVAISPNGKAALTASDEQGKTCLWKLGEGKPECILLTQTYYARSAAFSPDGKTLLTGDQSDKSAQLWNAETGKPVGAPLKHAAQVQAVTFSPDGKTALTASGKEVRLWSIETQQPVGPPLVSASAITSVILSPDGKLLAIGESTLAQLWDLQTRQPLGLPLRLMEGESSTGEEVACLAFSPDGQKLVAGGDSLTARMWDIPRSSLGWSLPHQDQIRAAVFSPDGKKAATGSNDKTARLWNVLTGEAIGPPLEHAGAVWTLAFSPDGTKLLTGSNDKTARLWDATTGRAIGPILHDSNFVMAVAFSPDGRTMLTAGSDVQFWDVDTGAATGALKHPPPSVVAMVLSPDGATLATIVDFDQFQLWDVETKTPLGPALDHQQAAPVGFTPDSKTLFTAGRERSMGSDRSIRLWDARTGVKTGAWVERAGGLPAGALRPDGKVMLTTNDAAALLVDAMTGKPLLPPMIHPGPVNAGAFHPDRKSLVTGCSDRRQSDRGFGMANSGEMRWWDGLTGKMLGAPQRHPVFVDRVAFSPDGATVLTGGADRTARLWKLPTPVQGEPERVTIWAEVVTGLELQESGVVRVLAADSWQARRAQLEKLDAPSVP